MNVVPRFFDRNANVEFLLLSLIALIFCVQLIFSKIELSGLVQILLPLLVLGTSISFLLGEGKINMLTGDTGRYTGLASLFALIVIAIRYSQVKLSDLNSHIIWLLITAFIILILGFLQYWGSINLPSGGGIGSTLGNSDFLSAWVGTVFPLIFIWKTRNKQIELSIKSLFVFIALLVLIVISVKQGLFDLFLFIALIGCYWAWRYFRRTFSVKEWSIWLWFGLLAFFTILWFELVFIIPYGHIGIPNITNDPQVVIRSQFWTSGVNMFVKNIWFGVGPDNFGNYYEKYRSLNSVFTNEYVLANDAHSSVVQSFATLGIVNILIFTALWILLIYAWLVNLNNFPKQRTAILLIGAYFLIFATNSMISPMTLPSKFIFWALAGMVIGNGLNASHYKWKLVPFKLLIASITAVTTFTALNFGYAQYQIISAFYDHSKDPKTVQYKFNAYLPCVIYFPTQVALATLNSNQTPIDLVRKQLSVNSRCITANESLARYYINKQDWINAKKAVYKMLDVAPARRDVIAVAAVYSLKANDKQLQAKLVAQGENLKLFKDTAKITTGSVPLSQITSLK